MTADDRTVNDQISAMMSETADETDTDESEEETEEEETSETTETEEKEETSDEDKGAADDEGGDETEADKTEEEEAETGDEESSEESEETEEESSEAEDLREQVANLTRTVSDLVGVVQKQKAEEDKKEEAFEPTDTEFVATEEDYANATGSLEGLNETLNKASSHGATQAVEYMMKKLPGLVQRASVDQASNAIAIHMFWRDNADLKKLGDANKSAATKVNEVYDELEKKYPTNSVEKNLNLLADAVRTKYGKAKKPMPKPTFPKKGGSGKKTFNKKSGKKKDSNSIGSQVERMMNV